MPKTKQSPEETLDHRLKVMVAAKLSLCHWEIAEQAAQAGALETFEAHKKKAQQHDKEHAALLDQKS